MPSEKEWSILWAGIEPVIKRDFWIALGHDPFLGLCLLALTVLFLCRDVLKLLLVPPHRRTWGDD